MLVKNLKDNLKAVPLVKADGTPTGEKMILLFTGWNEIPVALWESAYYALKSDIDVSVELKCKEEDIKDADGKKIGIRYIDQLLQDVRSDIARDVIKGCFNIPNLEIWAKDPKISSELRALADMQLADCKNGVERGERT
jgi:hypothetical protein